MRGTGVFSVSIPLVKHGEKEAANISALAGRIGPQREGAECENRKDPDCREHALSYRHL